METQAKGGTAVSADKTVGGRTRSYYEQIKPSTTRGRDGSRVGIEAPIGSLNLSFDEWDALIAAAFDSCGLRDGLERAAKIAESLNFSTLGQLVAALRAEASKLDGEEPRDWQAACVELQRRTSLNDEQIATALRVTVGAWASWREGRDEPHPAMKANLLPRMKAMPKVVPQHSYVRANPGIHCERCEAGYASHPVFPEPPAEERKLPLGHEYEEQGDWCGRPAPERRVGRNLCHVCGQPRSAHEPTR
jgi:hypothetical protein